MVPRKKKQLKILFVTSEVAPISKIGGLADVCWSLPRELEKLGHDIRIFTPKYGFIEEEKFKIKEYMKGLSLKTSGESIVCNIKTTELPGNIPVYLLENMEYYEKRANVYGYMDDSRRWYLLSRMVLEFLKKEKWQPDVIHSHDWMTGLVSNFGKTIYKKDKKINKIASLFTIHNLNHQGNFPFWEQREADKDDGKKQIRDFHADEVLKFNGIRRGVINSDIITTVSENYSREILNPEFGAGMDKLLREERMKLFGVINGLDYRIFSPSTDSDISVNYDKNSLEGKTENKIKFQKEYGLEVNKDVPLLGFVGRFNRQKGLDLIREMIESLINDVDFQFVIVGGGSEEWQQYFYDLMKRFPGKVGGHLMVSKIIGQQIYAASDIFLYPSLFEPCGLAHLIAMRYGSIPIVRKTGGLADTVKNFNPLTEEGNGFVFEEFDSTAFLIQVVRALETYKHKRIWKRLQRKVMNLDYSWKASALRYVELYDKAIDLHRRWLVKEKLIKAKHPEEVTGVHTIDPSR